MIVTPSETGNKWSEGKAVGLLLVAGFAALSIWGLPYAHDVANSGRYLMNVYSHN